ncbi:MAG: glycoside hydrolase family 127 protein [Bacteroidales bacterium]|nr:glycoside hydrolase family 127 protein [Bacteroidales bacterium]
MKRPVESAISPGPEPDPQLSKYLDDVILNIAAAQEDDGYLYTIRTIDPTKLHKNCGEERWSYLDHSHELYNVGHMYEAAVAHFQATGKRTLLDVAVKNADLICEVFGPGKNMGVPGHQEIEIGLVKLYRVTGDEKYLNLAQFFIDQRGNAEGHKLYGSYCQDHKPFVEQGEAVGHSVRAVYLYTGAADVAALVDNQEYIEVLEKIWQDMVYTKTYLTGGIGAEPKHEGFGPAYELPNGF